LGSTNFIARALAQRIAEELGDALVYPVLPYGHHRQRAHARPGNALSRIGVAPPESVLRRGARRCPRVL